MLQIVLFGWSRLFNSYNDNYSPIKIPRSQDFCVDNDNTSITTTTTTITEPITLPLAHVRG